MICPANVQDPATDVMVDSFSIRNFRSFNDVEVEGCSRINIVVGENGSGKTSLLEALFLSAGASPEITLRARAWRGIETGQISGTFAEIYAALWEDLFHKFKIAKPVVVSLKGKGSHNRSVSVQMNKPGAQKVVPPGRDKPQDLPRLVPEISPIEFRWKLENSRQFVSKPSIQDGRIIFPPTPDEAIQASFYASNRSPSSSEMVARFSKLSKAFSEDMMVSAFQKLYPSVVGISIEMEAGKPALFATLKDLPRKVPLSFASGGMNKLAELLLGACHQSNGVVFVDEIENGFYYNKLETIWASILEFSREFNTQIFASTHSLECLNAAAKIAKDAPDEFSLLQVYMENAESKVSRLKGDIFVSAVDERFELR